MPTNNNITHRENPLEATLTEDEGTEEPYRERIVGTIKSFQEGGTRKPLYHKKKCALYGKGFNSKSTFKMCHLCDKLQHTSCIGSQVEDDARFACIKCEPFKDAHEKRDKETPDIDDGFIGLIQNRN